MVITLEQNNTNARTPATTNDIMCVSAFGHNSFMKPHVGSSIGFVSPAQSIRTDAFMIL